MAPRETENNAYAKFRGDEQRTLWYVMVFSGVVNSPFSCQFVTIETGREPEPKCVSQFFQGSLLGACLSAIG